GTARSRSRARVDPNLDRGLPDPSARDRHGRNPGVRLRKLIGEIGAKYDRLLPLSSEAHGLLRNAEAEFKQWIPPGYLVEGNGGKGKPAITPRIALFNRDETTTIRQGIYIAYLFAADKSTVTLTLNQGVSEMAGHLGRAAARQVLALEATAIRAALRPK